MAENRRLAVNPTIGRLLLMSTVEEIEAAIQRLAPTDMAAFRAWFAEFDAAEWDRQIAADEAAGKLDWLIQEGLDDREPRRV